MPLKFTGRRKSSANVLDTTPEAAAPTQSSFRVLERVEKINLNGQPQQNGARGPVQRPFNSPLASLRGKSAEELGGTLNRGSGGTTASGSSGYYESSSASARHSSSSTLPSSVDAEREPREDELYPTKTKTAPMYRNHAADIDELPPPPRSFTSRAARALSFGQKHNRQGSGTEIHHIPPIPPAPSWPAQPARSHSPERRERGMTTSSYASTAKPEPLTLGASDFGSDFGNIFASSPKESPLPPPPVASQHKTESQPIFPRNFTTSRPSPDLLARERMDAGSPYSWNSRNSNEGLISSSALSSPRLDSGPPVPPHKGGMASDFLRGPKAGYSLVSDGQSPGLPAERDAFIYDHESDGDEYASDDETEVRGTQLRDTQQPQSTSGASFSSTSSTPSIPTRKPSGMPSQAAPGASRARAMSPDSSEGGGSLWASESMNATPKQERLTLPQHTEESMFDSSPQGEPSRAIRPGTHTRTESGTLKKMTKAQFERLQRGGDSSAEASEEEHHSEDDYEDEDDAERAKKLAKQRQKQEANMSVYRQQMKKVTGGGPSDLPSSTPRPNMDRASTSAPALGQGGFHLGGMGGPPPQDATRGKQGDDDDDDVPLGILQAHGFPNGSRPPTSDGMNQRRASAAGSVVMGGGGGQGNLPPFARRLPADPYFGSSLVNQSQRESLGFGGAPSAYGGAPSAYGGAPQQMQQQMQPQMGHPGGLIGVIAGEERAKAARRGSPNPATGYFNNPMPLPQNMPQMPRSMSMGSVVGPQVYTPSGQMQGMPPMPQMPQTPGMMPGMPGMQMPQMPQMPQMQGQGQEQMQKFMEMQMQLMQNMISMQNMQMGQTPQPQQQQAGDYLGFNFQPGTPSIQQPAPSINGGYTPSINQGRAMTMMTPPKGWDTPPAGRRPSSAMPTTYAPSGFNMGGPGQGYSPSIAPSERSNVGMPSRYRPVDTNGTNGNDYGRSQSMTSSMTLQALGNNTNRGLSPDYRPQTAHDSKAQSSTVRLIDKPKGSPRVNAKPVADEEEEDGWAEMQKKREDRKKFRFGKRSQTENNLGTMYHSYD